MPTIYQLPTQVPGLVGVYPNQKFAVFGDDAATITTAGYLNQVNLESNPISKTDVLQVLYSYNPVTNAGTYGIFTVSISGTGVITLVSWANPGDVLLPVVANHIAIFNGTSGQIYDGTATALHSGSIQAGASGTAGTFISYPATALKGSLILAAVANTGNTNVTISNAAMGQASVISIPDPGAATANFLLSANASTQHITTGSFEVDQGNVIAGSSGHAGTVISYPSTASKGSLIIAAVDNTGNTNTTISNAAMGQASVISIPDPGGATADFVLAAAALVSGNMVKASGTAGLIVDAGFAATNVMQLNVTNALSSLGSIVPAKVNGTEAANAVTASGMAGLITTSSLTTAGGASYAITWTNTFITATSVVMLSLSGGTNTVKNITLECVPGAGTATLTIYNNTAATQLDGTILISYLVM